MIAGQCSEGARSITGVVDLMACRRDRKCCDRGKTEERAERGERERERELIETHGQ